MVSPVKGGNTTMRPFIYAVIFIMASFQLADAQTENRMPALFNIESNCRTVPAITAMRDGVLITFQTESQDCTFEAGAGAECVSVPNVYGTRRVNGTLQRFVKAKSYGVCKSINSSGQKCSTLSTQSKMQGDFGAFVTEPAYSVCEGNPTASPSQTLTKNQNSSVLSMPSSSGLSLGSSKGLSSGGKNELLSKASELGRANALGCVELTRLNDGRTAIKNNCSIRVNYGYCYSNWVPKRSTASNPFKCDNHGTPSWGQAASVAAGETKPFPLQLDAESKETHAGPCMSEVIVEGTVFNYLHSERVSTDNSYRCKYQQKY